MYRHATSRRGALVFMGIAAAAAVGSWVAADPPAAPKVSSFAPAEDLIGQVDYFKGRVAKSLSNKAEFTDYERGRLVKDANTLAVLALVLAEHDTDHPLKKQAPALLKTSRQLASDSNDFDAATKALADVEAAMTGTAGDATAEVRWEKVAPLGPLMKQVPLVHNSLKRAVTGKRFDRQKDQAAGQAATLAAIAQAAMFDLEKVKNPADADKWYQFCADARDTAGEVNLAVRAGDQEKARQALARLNQSCEDCHAVFRQGPH